MLPRSWLWCLALLVSVFGTGAIASAQGAGATPVVVESLAVHHSAAGTAFQLRASGPLTWTTSLVASGRLLLELPDATPGPDVRDRAFRDPLVHRIEVSAETNGESSLTRILLHVHPQAEHWVSHEGRRLMIQFSPGAEPAPTVAAPIEEAAPATAAMQMAELTRQNADLTDQLEAAAGRAQATSELYEAAESRVHALQNELAATKTAAAQAEASGSQLAELRDRLAEVAAEKQDLTASLEGTNARLAASESARQALQQRLDGLAAATRDQTDDLERRLQDMTVANRELREELDGARNAGTARLEELQGATARVASLRGEEQQLRAQVARLDDRAQQLAQELSAAEASGAEWRHRAEQLDAQSRQLSADLDEARQGAARAENEAESARERAAEIEAELVQGSSTFRVRDDVSPCLNLRSEGSRTAPKIDCLAPGTEVTVLELRGDWRRTRLAGGLEGWTAAEFLEPAPASRDELESLRARSGQLTAEAEALKRDRDQARNRVADLERRLAAEAQSVSDLQAAQAESARARSTLEARISELESQVAAAQAPSPDTSGLEARVAQLESELATAQAAARSRSALEGRVAELESALADARAAGRAAANAAREAQETPSAPETTALEAKVADLERQLASSREAARRSREESLRLAQARDELRDRVTGLEVALRTAGNRRTQVAARTQPEPSVEAPLEPLPAGPQAGEPVAVLEPLPVIPDPEAIQAAVHGWAGAWSGQRVDDYLAAYAPEFRPAGGLSRPAWEAQRRQRLRTPAFIEVEITDLEILSAEPERARVRFHQAYRSNTFSDEVLKTLELVSGSDTWQISAETSEPVAAPGRTSRTAR